MPSSALNAMDRRERDKKSSPGGHLNIPRVFREAWPKLNKVNLYFYDIMIKIIMDFIF